MRSLSRLTSPGGLTAIAVGLIVVIGGIILATSHPTSSKPATPESRDQSSRQATVSVKNLDGAQGSADWLKPLGHDIFVYSSIHDPDSSIYIEDLTKHQATLIGPADQYNTKSLMKVPLVMNLYRAAELGKVDLDAPVSLEQDQLDKAYGNLWRKGAGYQLSLRDAAKLALQESDNTAIRLINAHTSPLLERSARSTAAMNMNIRVNGDGDAFVSAESYSVAFRCLYSACYLNREDSDTLLDLMKSSEFNAPSKLLPANTVVAHKIGSVNDPHDQGGYIGFNDCGIVFSANRPFIFCIMLKTPEPEADEDVSQIIKKAYDFLQKHS
jgi:beta-lactamase class A